MIKKILILAANPKGTDQLRLDQEVSEIKKTLSRAKKREKFDVKAIWEVGNRDFQTSILDYQPQFVHFSGHGEKEGLIVVGDENMGVPVSSEALSGLFKLCAGHVECVILNACYSAQQAVAINRHIDYVIGMPQEILDRAAIEFSFGFYNALGDGKTIEIEKAFEHGLVAMKFLNIPTESLPQLFVNSLPKKLIKKGLENLERKIYKHAFAGFQKALEIAPHDERVRFYYCLSFLSGKPLHSIKKDDMNDIFRILKNVILVENQTVISFARILLGIIWIDYYLKKDHHSHSSFFKENKEHLGDYHPSEEEKEMIHHIIYSDTAKVLFRLS